MLCQNCGKNEANIRYTQIVNGVKKEMALCSDCAEKLGVENMNLTMGFGNLLGDFFNDFLMDFMENRNYFNLDKDELVKIIEYFCFWLFSEGYTDSHIAKVD